MAKQVKIICNPTAGREQVQRYLPEITACLEENGWTTLCHATQGPGSATLAAKEAAVQKFDLILAAGGDGTIHEVINGLAEQAFRPRFGIIPLGTTNDLAAAMGISKNVDDICKMLQEGFTVPVDIGKLNESRFFINIAAAGALTEVTYEVPSKLKTVIGQLAYYLKGIEKLPHMRPSWMRIEYDAGCFEGEAMFFMIANTRSVGGFNRLAPQASINDGKFDLIIIKKTSVINFIQLANAALRGQHLNDPTIVYTQAKKIKVTAEKTIGINLDGEYGGELPGEFSNLPRHLQMMVPR
ncbi:MAG: diacylglycerol kinase [Bacillota bacterium]